MINMSTKAASSCSAPLWYQPSLIPSFLYHYYLRYCLYHLFRIWPTLPGVQVSCWIDDIQKQTGIVRWQRGYTEHTDVGFVEIFFYISDNISEPVWVCFGTIPYDKIFSVDYIVLTLQGENKQSWFLISCIFGDIVRLPTHVGYSSAVCISWKIGNVVSWIMLVKLEFWNWNWAYSMGDCGCPPR